MFEVRFMTDLFSKHSKNLFQTNLGMWLAGMACFAWIINQLCMHQAIDIPNAVSLIGFLFFFYIERSHGREMKAIHLKLDELLAAQAGASNRLIRAEEASEETLNLAHEALHLVASNAESHAVVSIDHTDFFEEHNLTAA
jgi:low affinity Fe/Cu permease